MHDGTYPDDAEGLDEQARRALEMGDLLALDGPQHARLRQTIARRFSVRAARMLEGAIRQVILDVIAELTSVGPRVDLTERFSEPISAAVHCLLLGVPEVYWPSYYQTFVRGNGTQCKFDFVRQVLGADELPAGGILADLRESSLEASEIEGLTFVLMVSGRDSVAFMISASVLALLENPEQRDLWVAKAVDDNGAVEELMRFATMFLTLFPRTATEQGRVGRAEVQPGQTVSVSPVGANRDPVVFPDPDVLDLRRDAFGHLAFGHGPHGCLGQQVARLELRVAITELLRHFPKLTVFDSDMLRPKPFGHPVAVYSVGSVVADLGPHTLPTARSGDT